jgi:hypothetical protein
MDADLMKGELEKRAPFGEAVDGQLRGRLLGPQLALKYTTNSREFRGLDWAKYPSRERVGWPGRDLRQEHAKAKGDSRRVLPNPSSVRRQEAFRFVTCSVVSYCGTIVGKDSLSHPRHTDAGCCIGRALVLADAFAFDDSVIRNAAYSRDGSSRR